MPPTLPVTWLVTVNRTKVMIVNSTERVKGWLPTFGAAIPLIILFISVLSIVLTAAQNLGLTEAQTSSWILALYGLPGLFAMVMTFLYRQPLLYTGNIFVIVFISSLGREVSYPGLIGATILAGVFVMLIAALGLVERISAWIPKPIVLGLLAGVVMPFVADIFTSLPETPWIVGGTFLAYLLSRRFLGERVPPILPALVAGIVMTAITGQFGQVNDQLVLPIPVITFPVFSLEAILTATPVIIVFVLIQANLPSLIYLQTQNYEPPERPSNLASGLGTVFGSFLGPTGVSLSLPATSLVANPEAGEHDMRRMAVYIVSVAAVIVGLLAGIAAELLEIIPIQLLLTLAGLALVNILINSLKEIIRSPLLLGPVFSFAIALSGISFLGFGRYFWALVLGTIVSLMLEGDGLKKLRSEKDE